MISQQNLINSIYKKIVELEGKMEVLRDRVVILEEMHCVKNESSSDFSTPEFSHLNLHRVVSLEFLEEKEKK